MIIGIDASRAFRIEKTGTEWYSYYLIREMVRRIMGSKERELQSVKCILYTDQTVLHSIFGGNLPPCVILKHLIWPLRRFWTQGRLSLEMLLRPPDVLFVPAHAIPFIHPRRTVTTIHDVGFLRYPAMYSSKDLANLQWSTSFACKNARAIITISEFSKREIISHYAVTPETIHVVHLGYDAAAYDCLDAEEIKKTRRTYGLEERYLLCIGRIDERKNIPLLIDIFEKLKSDGYSGKLVLIGPFGYKGESMREKIMKSKCTGDIQLLGWIEERQKILLLKSADCLVFPSLYEGFGLPVIEAQACGTPVICSNSAALPEVGGKGAIYCDPNHAKEFVRAITQVLGDESVRDRLIREGYENCKRFSWQEAARKTLSVLSSVAR